jgi:hypothetical protein
MKRGDDYLVEFTADVILQRPAYENGGVAFVPPIHNPKTAPIFPTGETQPVKGAILYEPTEKGWRDKKFQLLIGTKDLPFAGAWGLISGK